MPLALDLISSGLWAEEFGPLLVILWLDAGLDKLIFKPFFMEEMLAFFLLKIEPVLSLDFFVSCNKKINFRMVL